MNAAAHKQADLPPTPSSPDSIYFSSPLLIQSSVFFSTHSITRFTCVLPFTPLVLLFFSSISYVFNPGQEQFSV